MKRFFTVFRYSPRAIALSYVTLEAFLVILLLATQRGLAVSQSLLRALLGQKVNVLILEKALTLNLTHFEDSEFYDKLNRARREASHRPLSFIARTFQLGQDSLATGNSRVEGNGNARTYSQ
jgi:ATP-binding cassette, subfamily B, bacterial